ncbi:GGDEF domain-containing response regulator [Novipirellula sp. SH528]|uniref:GGDEF domain-containing response regulator n=1 Tax=Novipirellula sp. SH528 TaxID=3454466 RepID=UPI003FA06D1B
MQVLLVEDQESETLLIKRLLAHSPHTQFVVDHAVSLGDAIVMMSEVEYDVCILDLGLPDGQGIDSLHQVRAIDARLPIVVLTGNDDESLGILAIETGAQDFMAKDNVSALLLTRSLRYAMARQKKMLGYASDANTDVLTGMPNRRQLDKRFSELIDTTEQLCVALLDIDHFKTINDRHGHLVGDQVLRHLADVIRNSTDSHVQAARFGGEEFALLLPETSCDSACEIIETLLADIASSSLVIEGTPLTVTASAGVSQVKKTETLEDILRRTDVALYDAKRAGRNCYTRVDVSDTE